MFTCACGLPFNQCSNFMATQTCHGNYFSDIANTVARIKFYIYKAVHQNIFRRNRMCTIYRKQMSEVWVYTPKFVPNDVINIVCSYLQPL